MISSQLRGKKKRKGEDAPEVHCGETTGEGVTVEVEDGGVALREKVVSIETKKSLNTKTHDVS